MKNVTEIVEILAAHADALNRGDDNEASLLAGYPHYADEMRPLFYLARLLKGILVPVHPPAGFVSRLQHQLVSVENAPAGWGYSRFVVWAGALLGSTVPLLGLLLYVYRRYRQPVITLP